MGRFKLQLCARAAKREVVQQHRVNEDWVRSILYAVAYALRFWDSAGHQLLLEPGDDATHRTANHVKSTGDFVLRASFRVVQFSGTALLFRQPGLL